MAPDARENGAPDPWAFSGRAVLAASNLPVPLKRSASWGSSGENGWADASKDASSPPALIQELAAQLQQTDVLYALSAANLLSTELIGEVKDIVLWINEQSGDHLTNEQLLNELWELSGLPPDEFMWKLGLPHNINRNGCAAATLTAAEIAVSTQTGDEVYGG
jgi:hypothetical protein